MPLNIRAETPLEESIPALDEIRKAGKTKYIGLSECSAKTLRKANSSTLPSCCGVIRRTHYVVLVAKIDALQAEYSAFETLHETDDLIATAKELGVAYMCAACVARVAPGVRNHYNVFIVQSIQPVRTRMACG